MSWRAEQAVYARHVWALFRAGSGAPAHHADPNEAGDIAEWSDEQVKTLIDEGRRQLDRQNDDLERVRGRAQVALAIAIALGGAAGALRATVSSADHFPLWVLWIVGLLLVGWAILGVAATAVVRADMQIIHAGVLSRYTGDIDRQLAEDYAAIAVDGENQVATRLTNLRIAVAFLLVGATATLGAWLWAGAAQTPPAQKPHNEHVVTTGAHSSPPPLPGAPPVPGPGARPKAPSTAPPTHSKQHYGHN
ncbi:MAG: hypothetical protein ACHQCH_03960 [Solirubrobacterales bacterium]